MPADRAVHVFFFGDSICFGQGVALHKGWVTQASRILGELGARFGREVIVINASVNGNTTRQALERMPYDVQSHGVDVMIVQFGMNDCNCWETDRGAPRVSPQAFAANLEEIVDRAYRFGAQALLLNTNHPTTRDQAPMAHAGVSYQEQNARYNEIIRQVARATARITLVDVERAFWERTGGDRTRLLMLLLPDGLHLSEAGHGVYSEIIEPPLVAAVELVLKAGGPA